MTKPSSLHWESARLKDFLKYLERDVAGGCQHSVTGCVVAKPLIWRKWDGKGVRGAEGLKEVLLTERVLG